MSSSCGLLCLTQPCKLSEVKLAKQNLIKRGFSKVNNYLSKDTYLDNWCGNPKERLKHFYDSWNSKDKVIFFIKGGSGTDHVLSKIDFKKLKKKDKMYVGYSDATSLLNAIFQYKGNICLHGPMSLKKIDKKSFEILQKALNKQDYGFYFKDNIIQESIKGIAVGGNLSRLVEYTPRKIRWNFNNKILFLEDTEDVTKYRFINLILSLKENHDVNPLAIILGYLKSEDISYIEESLKEIFPNVPIISGISFGHQLPNYTFPIGAECKIDFKNKKIKFIFPKSAKKSELKF